MGFYSRVIFPRLCDCLMGLPSLTEQRKMLLADGCRLDLDVEAVVRGQPFRDVQIERFEMEQLPHTQRTMYRGVAVR